MGYPSVSSFKEALTVFMDFSISKNIRKKFSPFPSKKTERRKKTR
jgi:hypothetical protein